MAFKLLVNEWLCEYKSVQSCAQSEQEYAITVFNYPDLINGIFDVLEDESLHEEYLENICDQLFKFYRSKEQRLRLFSLMYIPTLIGIHLTNCCNAGAEKTYRCVDVLLLGIYNLEIVDEEGDVVNRTFRVPALTKPSIFHEPSSLSLSQHSALTEHALLRLESGGGDVTLSSFGPYSEYDVINCGNRMNIMTVLLNVYNQQLSSVPKQSYLALCDMAIKIIRHGSTGNKASSGNIDNTTFTNYSQFISQTRSRIPLSSQFLIQLLSCVYFCMFNDAVSAGYQALEEIHNIALSNLYADVLMMSMAIKNSLKISPSGQPSDGPMGISVALSPTATSSASGVCKAAITNASFRTKKLPDDIPIVTATNSSSVPHLASINEESEECAEKDKTIKPVSAGSSKQSSSGINVAKIPVLQLLKDRKERKKEVNTTAKNKARSENGDVIHKAFNDSGDNADVESDTSGISEPKSGYGSDHEMIPLTTYIATSKVYADDQNSCNTSGNAVSVPLMNTSDSRNNSTSIHNETETFKDEIICDNFK